MDQFLKLSSHQIADLQIADLEIADVQNADPRMADIDYGRVGHTRDSAGMTIRLIRSCMCRFLLTMALLMTISVSPAHGQEELQKRELIQVIHEIEQTLSQRNWLQAAALFDAAWSQICEGEDPSLMAMSGNVQQLQPGQSELLAGGRARMEKVFQDSDPSFRTEYRRQFASVADNELQQAIAAGSQERLKHIAARFRFVTAGETATRILARDALDRAEYLDATLRLEQLRRLSELPSGSAANRSLRLQIAIAAWRAGLTADAESELRSLIAENGAAIQSGSAALTLPSEDSRLSDWFVSTLGAATGRLATAASSAAVQPQWPQMKGDFRRAAPQATGPVSLQPRWEVSLFEVSDFLFAEQMNPVLRKAQAAVRQLHRQFTAENSTVVPVAAPLVIGDHVIFRTVAGLNAVNAITGELVWEATMPDGRLRSAIDAATALDKRRRESAVAETRDDPGTQNSAPLNDGSQNPGPGDMAPPPVQVFRGNGIVSGRGTLEDYQAQILPNNIFLQKVRTNTAEQLASNGETIFAVEDSAWVTWEDLYESFESGGSRLPANYLRAYDAKSGIFRWEAGGQRTAQPKVNALSGYYFLGAPLVLGSRVYVLAESREGVFLLQLGEPDFRTAAPASANPRVLHSQLLTVPQYPLTEHPLRKHAGLVPSYAQGLLICTTCDERIFAISAEDHSVRWVYRYRAILRTPDIGMGSPVLSGALNSVHSARVDGYSRWTDTLPRIVGRRILITPRDSDELFCIDLHTGQELWRTPRGLARSIAAVTDQHVVVSGNKLLMAITLENGELVWTQQLREGSVSGTAAFDERVVHVPTSASTIVSFDIATGRQLLTRHVKAAEPVGNLLMLNDQLISQGLTTIASYGGTTANDASTPLAIAQQHLLQRNFDDAIAILNREVDQLAMSGSAAVRQTNADESLTVRQLLIDVLMESLRVDFVANRGHIPRLRELIQTTAVDGDQAVSVLMSMLGMNINDAAILPSQLERMDESGRRLDQLFEMMVDGLYAMRDSSAEELSAAIAEFLPALQSDEQQFVVAGLLMTRHAQVLAGGIERVLAARSPEDQRLIEERLTEQTALLIRETQLSATDRLQLIRDCAAAGLHRVARQLMSNFMAEISESRALSEAANSLADPPQNLADVDRSANPQNTLVATGAHSVVTPEVLSARARITQELLWLQAMRSDSQSAAEALTSLLDNWHSHGRNAAIRSLVSDLQSTDGTHPEARLKHSLPEADVVATTLPKWLQDNPEFLSTPPEIWKLAPTVTASDDRTMLSAEEARSQGPIGVIPMFGAPGVFRGWTFCHESDSTAVVAVDPDGRRMWSFDPGFKVPAQFTGQITHRYLLSSGHLLVLKLFDRIFVLDTSHATVDESPVLLWTLDSRVLHTDSDSNMVRETTPGWLRIPNYEPQPAGMYPCGPLTAEALPVISGSRLVVFDTVTGQVKWMLNGLSDDARLLSTDSELMILSESSQQIEQRRLTDGQLTGVARIPTWWMDANEGVGSSVRDIDVEPGQQLHWRIAVHGRHCVLFTLGFSSSTLECRDVLTDQTIWSVTLPQNSVFSNIAEDMVAVLCEGHTLKLFRLDTGTELMSAEVTQVPESRNLYLRPQRDHLIVLPEAVENPSLHEKIDPISDGLHVNGRMYAVQRNSLQLAWDQPLDHLFLRTLQAGPGPVIPNAPVLVLLSRYRKDQDDSVAIVSRYATRVFDVATGQAIDLGDEADDVGRTLNDHWMSVQADKQQILLSFENRIFTLKYGTAESND